MEDAISRAIRLSLLEKGKQDSLRADIEKTLSFVAEVQSITAADNTEGTVKENVFREDAVTVPAGTYRERMLAQAPKRFRDWFLSKKILP